MVQPRTNRKPSSKREPKRTPSKSLQETCHNLLQDKIREERERISSVAREKSREEEDAVMAMIYGPDWKNRP